MHLLSRLADGAFKLTTFHDDKPPPYAILSHTWGEEEVTYADLIAGSGNQKSGYEKLHFCAEKAAADGLEYFWVDTCCIDKSLSHELSTAINSMFRWYQRAARCYVFMADVSSQPDLSDAQRKDLFLKSRWFTRGWTLQELIASYSVEFYSKDGHHLGNRMSLEAEIHSATGIPVAILRGHDLSTASHEEKLKWVKSRTTTLKEDKAYCLLGLFGVYLPLIYGEGEDHAFDRLEEEIERQQRRGKGRKLEEVPKPLANSILPFERPKDFIGRSKALTILTSHILPLQSHKRFRIGGWSGAGKTSLAIEFACRVVEQYPRCQVFWLSARSLNTFKEAYREIATILGIPSGQPYETEAHNGSLEYLEKVREHLSQRCRNEWLLIVDDADHDENDVDNAVDYGKYLPWSEHGAIIFISLSRSRSHVPGLKETRNITLRGMQSNEAMELLKRHTVPHTLLGPQAGIDQMLERISFLPAAIVRASAHINNDQISPSEYVVRINNNSDKFPGVRSEALSVWKSTLSRLGKRPSQYIDALALLAYMDHTDLEPSLLVDCAIYTTVRFASTLRLLEDWGLLLKHVKQHDPVPHDHLSNKSPRVHQRQYSSPAKEADVPPRSDLSIARKAPTPPPNGSQPSSYYLCPFFAEALAHWIDDEYGKLKAIENLQLVIRTQFQTKRPGKRESFVPHARSLLRFRDQLSTEATLELLALVARHDVESEKTRTSGSQLLREIVDIIAKSQRDDFTVAIPTLLDLADCLHRVDRVAEAEKVLRSLLPAWARPIDEHFGLSVGHLARPKDPPDDHLTSVHHQSDLKGRPYNISEEGVAFLLAQLERRKSRRMGINNPETGRLQKLLWLRMKETFGLEHISTLHCSVYTVRDLIWSGELENARKLAESTQLQLCQVPVVDERWYWEATLILTYYLERLAMGDGALELTHYIICHDGGPCGKMSNASALEFEFSLWANIALCAQRMEQQELSSAAIEEAAEAIVTARVLSSPHASLAVRRIANSWELLCIDKEAREMWTKAARDLNEPAMAISLWHYDWQEELDAVNSSVRSTSRAIEASRTSTANDTIARSERRHPQKPAKLSTGAKMMRWIKD